MASNNDDHQLLVIGAGISRTGTMSLKRALEQLYQKQCYHAFELVKHGTSEIAKWDALCDKVLDNPEAILTRDDFDSIFNNYSMSTDAPTNGFVFQLMRIYPNAKIILTIRDPREWLASMRATARPKKFQLSVTTNWIDRLVERLLLGSKFLFLADKAFKMTLGRDIDLTDDLQLVEGYNAWNEKVKSMVPADRLLVFEVRQGWEPLCKFLGFPIPNDQPFPHVNDRREFTNYIKRQQMVRYLVHTMIGVSFVLVSILIGYWFVK